MFANTCNNMQKKTATAIRCLPHTEMARFCLCGRRLAERGTCDHLTAVAGLVRQLSTSGYRPFLTLTLTAAQLRDAADVKEKIASLETELAEILGALETSDKTCRVKTEKKREGMRDAGRPGCGIAKGLVGQNSGHEASVIFTRKIWGSLNGCHSRCQQDLPILQDLAPMSGRPVRIFCVCMKKLHTTKSNTPIVPKHRSFRRFVRKLIASFIKRQTDTGQDGFKSEVIQRLKDLEEKIESVARETVRKVKRAK